MHVAVGASLLLGTVGVAQESTEPTTAGYHLKRRSSFQAAQTTRSPFWPIGWSPRAKNAPAPAVAPVQEFTLKPEQFSVTSILLGNQSLAVINGRTYGEGEFIRSARALQQPNAPAVPGVPANVRIRVNRIVDGQVILQAGTQVLAVPLRRSEIPARTGAKDEELLLQAQAER
jgi:hypothetical protein